MAWRKIKKGTVIVGRPWRYDTWHMSRMGPTGAPIYFRLRKRPGWEGYFLSVKHGSSAPFSPTRSPVASTLTAATEWVNEWMEDERSPRARSNKKHPETKTNPLVPRRNAGRGSGDAFDKAMRRLQTEEDVAAYYGVDALYRAQAAALEQWLRTVRGYPHPAAILLGYSEVLAMAPRDTLQVHGERILQHYREGLISAGDVTRRMEQGIAFLAASAGRQG